MKHMQVISKGPKDAGNAVETLTIIATVLSAVTAILSALIPLLRNK